MLTSLREGPQQRPATPDEQRVLARWAGWGAVPQLFDEHLDDFAEQRAELKQLLTEQQYRAAARSTINAHYTDAALVKVIWEGLAQLGFTGGTVLEPGCGSGHFIGLAPDDARMVGVEREPISAAIAAALYPHADIHTASFADITAAEGSFDAAIGNVPFANITLHDPRHNSGKHSLHNHFIIKSLHLTRPGGMVAVLTSRYTMDARNPAARREMAQLADLVSAIRLPSGAHRRAAGTEVVTDLLILRRREPDRAPAEAAGWERVERTPLGDDGTTVEINRYFLDHPDHVLGELSLGRGRFGAEDLVVRGEITDLSERLATVLERVAADAVGRGLGMTPPPETPVESRPATTVSVVDPEAARFEGFLAARPDGSFTRRVGGTDQPYTPPAKQAEELRALLGLRDTAMALIKAEQATVDDTSEITGLRAELNRRYEAYREQYGAINRYTVRRQARQGWHVFRQWCEQHGYESMPADPAALRAYMQHLLRAGIGQDILSRHLDSITKAHTRAFDREVAKAATQLARHDSDPAEARRQLLEEHPPLDLLRRAHLPDLRMPEDSIRAAEEIIAQAPQKTSNLVDLDELGLRNEIINRPPQGGFGDDPFANYVRALEKFDPSTQTARKADILLRRVINPTPQRLGAETAEEALSICLDTHSRVDLAVIAQLLGLPGPQEARAALGELVYDDPDLGEPVWAPLYLSGNVRQKLARAELAAADNPAFEVNVAALRRVVPKDLGPEDIEVRLGSWIGPEYVQAFLRDILGDHSVTVESVAGMWAIDNKDRRKSVRVAATEIWGAGGLDAYELTEKLLVGTPIQVKKTIEVDGVEREVLDVEATENAQDKAVEIGNRFADWIWEDTRRAASVMRRYNELFNAEIPADFSGVELSLPGLSQAYELRPHQKEAVARIIYQPATGLVHDVGAGKTLEIIVGMMERRRRGLATKPMVVVPNDSIAEQFERQWLQAYPNARLLTAGSAELADDKKKGRNGRAEFVARVATGDWDAVILTKEAFQRIPLPEDAQEDFLRAELDALEAEKRSHIDVLGPSMTKRLESAMEAAEQRLKSRLADIERDVAGMTLADAGVDYLVVDEAQNYKNGMVNSAIPDLVIEGAHRSIDLDMKLSWLQKKHGSARVVLATATPWTGKFSEVYLWLRRLGHDLPRFDAWARTFVTSASFMEMTPGGTLRPKTRTRGTINEPELWRQIRLTSDVKMQADLRLPIPPMRGGKVEVVTVPASPEARVLTLDLARREKNLSGPPKPGEDNHLVIAHDGQLVATDLRTVGVQTNAPQKVDVLADDIHHEWSLARDNVYLRDDGTEHPVRGGLILVFCDESTPSNSWNFYHELRAQLVARGMAEDTIRFIHEAGSPQRRADLLAACREGAVSVLVGSTAKMGAGLNVQDRVIGGYEITPPWRPDISVQAIGRAGRQGNQNPEFFWKRLVLAPSLDAKKWEIASQKHTMFEPLYSSNEPARSRELATDDELGLADAMTAATGDPRYREKADLDRELKALKRQHSAYLRRQQALKLTISASRERIPKLEEKADRQDAVARRRVDTRGEQFRMTIRSTTYTSRTKAAEALVPLVEAAAKAVDRWSYEPEEVTLGQIGGFTLAARARSLPKPQILLYFADAPDSSTGVILDPDELPTGRGLITRIENQLDALATEGDRTREQIEEERRTITASHEALGQPFPGAARMEEVTRRRAELISQLSAGEEEAADPNEDPNSPEARARAARREARARELRELYDTARDLAQHQHGLSVRAAQTFASWYQTITSPVVADQRPPIDTALSVWTAIGRPDSGGRSRLRTLGAAEVQATTDEDVTHDPSQADTTADTAHRDADTPTVDPTPPPTTEPATRTTDAATAESPLSAILAASDRIQLHHIGPTTRENSTRTQEKRRATPANDMPDRAPTGEASQTPHSDDSPAPESTDAVDTTALTKAGLNDEVLTAAAPTVQPPETSPADLPTENSAEAPEQAPERTVELPPEPTAMLRRFRELGGKQGLQVSVVRVAEAVFVTLHEPVTPQQPVLCWPAESTQAFDGAARPVALDAIEDYLQRYRSAVDPAWFTLDTRVRHWARRMAQLAPHVVPGARDDQQELAELVQQAVQHATSDERHAEDLLRRAERETTPLRLAPSREAQVVRTIHDLAPGYAPAGDVGRYLTDPAHLDGTWQEWEWINNYTREHPEVLSGTTALNRIRKRDADEAAEREKAATALVKQASTAFRARDFERALDLIDRAELLYPEGLARWDRARHRVMAKAEQLEDSSSEPTSAETPPTDEVSRSVVPAPEATAADAASEASVAEPKTAGEPMMPVLPADVQVALYAQINHEAARWFEAQLDSSPEAQRYLERRLGGADKVRRVRLTVNVTGGLCIGYAPDSWTGLVDHLRQQGFQEQDLVDAGVATVSSRGTLIDRFRGRIMFGIRNRRGLLAGFTGRALSDSASAKYLNSPASVLFDKSKLLFGLYEQAPVAPHADAIVAVEGPFDVAATLANTPQRCPIVVVAPCGTALTSGHLDAIDALVPRDRRRVFAFDADASGRKAVIERATDALGRYEELGLTTLPDGQDPAEYALSVGPEENAAAYLGPPHTRPAVEMLVEARLQRWRDRVQWVDGQVDAARDVATLLAVLNPDRVSDLVVRLAERLQVDATYLAEFIADARHAQGLPPDRPLRLLDQGDTNMATAEAEQDQASPEPPVEASPEEESAQPNVAGERSEPKKRQEPGLVIEHGHPGTVVRGTDKNDLQLREILQKCGFKWSRRQGIWHLPRSWKYDTRDWRVQELQRALDAAERPYTTAEPEKIKIGPVPPPPADAVPFESLLDLKEAQREVHVAFSHTWDTPAGRNLISSLTYSGYSEGSPEGRALHKAMTQAREYRGDDATELLKLYQPVYETAYVLQATLVAERKRAPKLMTRLKELVQRSQEFVARLTASRQHDEEQLHQLLRETDRGVVRQDAERTAATSPTASHGTDRAAQADEPPSMGAPVSASPAGEQGSLFSSFEVMSSAADAVASRPAAPRTDQDETTTSGTSTTDDQDQVPEQTDDRAPQSAPIAPPSTGMPATPAAPTDGVELSASGRRAVAAIEFVPAATRAWPVPEQLADMSIPGPVREYEPARLAFVHTQRAVREPGMSPAHRATIIVNLAGGQTSEAVEVAQHLQALAALIDASGQSDRLADGSSLAQYLRDTSDAITRRLAGTPEAASVVPPTPALSSPVEAVRPGDDAAAALPVDGPDSPTPTPLVANVSFQDSATAVASASREAPDHGPDDALDEEDAEPLSGLAEEEMGSSPQRADELAELADLWADVADSDSVEPTPATPPQTLDAAADTTAEAEAVSARSEAVSAATPPTDSTADSAPSETTVSEERLAEQWATLVERAADLGYAVQTRYATSSTRLPESQPTVFVDAELPAHERLVDLALQVVEIATTQARVQTTPQPPLPGPRQTEQPLFARHTGHLDVTLAEPDGPTRGQLSGTLDLPCDEKLWPRVSGQLPLHEHAAATVVRPPAHTLAGHADAAAARLPGSPPSRRYTATFGEQPRPGATRT